MRDTLDDGSADALTGVVAKGKRGQSVLPGLSGVFVSAAAYAWTGLEGFGFLVVVWVVLLAFAVMTAGPGKPREASP